jgi:hypothetical protein
MGEARRKGCREPDWHGVRARRCSGCDSPEGFPRVIWRRRRGRDQLVREEGAIVRLIEMNFADYGPRLFCEPCRRIVMKRLTRLFADGMAVCGREPRPAPEDARLFTEMAE